MRRAALFFIFVLCALAPRLAKADLSQFAFDPHPGAHLPLATKLTDARGHTVELGTFFGKHPVILVLEYLRCRSLCGVTLNSIVTALKALPLKPGRDFDLVAVSIDPRDTSTDALKAKTKYAAEYGHSRATGFHFLTGNEKAVRKIATDVGFPYRFEARLGTYIHPAGFMIVTPQGNVSSYIEGVSVAPARLVHAISDAEQLKYLSPLSRILLFCHVQGAPLGRFTVPVFAAFITANIAGGIALIFLFASIRRRRHG